MRQLIPILNDKELYHHGVKGMKWGVRHDKERANLLSRNDRNLSAMQQVSRQKQLRQADRNLLIKAKRKKLEREREEKNRRNKELQKQRAQTYESLMKRVNRRRYYSKNSSVRRHVRFDTGDGEWRYNILGISKELENHLGGPLDMQRLSDDDEERIFLGAIELEDKKRGR